MSEYNLNYSGRVKKLRKRMKDEQIESVLLFERGNVRYFTGWHQNPSAFSLLFISEDQIAYFVPELDFSAAKNECWIDSDNIYEFEVDPLDKLQEVFNPGTVDVIGIEQNSILSVRKEKLISYFSPEFRDVNQFIKGLRMIKSSEEIKLYRVAAKKTSEIMKTIMDEIHVGIKERDISARAKYLMETLGAEGQSFEPFLMSGAHSWMPHRSSTNKKLENGDLALLDMGMMWYGYSTDMTRTFMLGQPTKEQERIFKAAVEAQQVAIDALEPNVKAEDIHSAAVKKLEEYGLAAFFPHLTGHGVGCDIHEAPIVDQGQSIELQPGMITTIEPGVYKEGVGGVRLEDMVLITESGHEVLTEAPRDFLDLVF